MTVLSADNHCKPSDSRSGPTFSGAKLFDTDGIPEFVFRKSWRQKHAKLPSRQRVNTMTPSDGTKYNLTRDSSPFVCL